MIYTYLYRDLRLKLKPLLLNSTIIWPDRTLPGLTEPFTVSDEIADSDTLETSKVDVNIA